MQNLYFQLDCWDGPDGEPIIYHGWTLTSKLLFADVLSDAIAPYAFTASPFPLILSIENHCSSDQQDRMAQHFREILGEHLFTQPVDSSLSKLPSPEFFKNKILIKAKKLKLVKKSITADESFDNETLNIEKQMLDFTTEIIGSQDRKMSKEENNIPATKTSSKALSDLVNYTEAVKFTGFQEEGSEIQRNFWEMSSFEESKASSFTSNDSTARQFLDYNVNHLSRIYPKGTRLFSSNLG